MNTIFKLILVCTMFFFVSVKAMEEPTNLLSTEENLSPLDVEKNDVEKYGRLGKEFLYVNGSEGELVTVEVSLDYTKVSGLPGNNLRKLHLFLLSLGKHISQYKMSTVEQIIRAEDEEKKNLDTFAQYIVSELFWLYLGAGDESSREVTPNEFRKFKAEGVGPFGHAYKNNSVFFSLLHYLSNKNALPLQMKNKERLYDNLNFKFKPVLADDEIGQKIKDFTFDDVKMPERYNDPMARSKNTLHHTLVQSDSVAYPCEYQFEVFRLKAANTYRVQVYLSSQDPFQPKIFNFIMEMEAETKYRKPSLNVKSVSNVENSKRFIASSCDKTLFGLKPYFIRAEFNFTYNGNDPEGLAKFKKHLDDFVLEYSPIEISDDDKKNLDNFAQYIVSELSSAFNFEHLPNYFREFKNRKVSPFLDHSFNNNIVFFSLLYYLNDKLASPLQTKNYILRPLYDGEIGQKIEDFTFANVQMPVGYGKQIEKGESENTLCHVLVDSRASNLLYPCQYKFKAFKLSSNTYRVQVKLLSSQDPNRSPSLKVRKIFNFVIQVN